MHPAQFRTFYLQKNVAIVNEEPQNTISSESLEQAVRITTLKTSGMNPLRLAPYPKLMAEIEQTTTRSTQVKNIEQTFMKRLVNMFTQHDARSISNYVDELLQTKDKEDVQLAQRILSLLKEIEECAICYENKSDTFFQCGHRVCSNCSSSLRDCPFCRASILTRLKEIEEEEKLNPTRVERLPKFNLVEDLPNFIRTRFLGLLKRSSTLDSNTAKEISTLIQFYPNDIFELYKANSSKVRAEEAITYLAGRFFFYMVLEEKLNHTKWTDSQKTIAEFLAKPIRTPSRLIRFLSTIAIDEAIKDKPVKIKLSNTFRKWIVEVINKFDLIPAENEINKRKGFWVWLFKKLHIRESKWKKFTTALSLAEFARGTRKATEKSVMHEFNQLYTKADPKLLAFFIERPGLCFRFFRCSLYKLQSIISQEDWLAFLRTLIPKLKPVHIVELLHILQSIPALKSQHPIVYRVKNGQFFWSDKLKTPDFSTNFVTATIELLKTQLRVPYRLLVDTSFPLENLRLARGRPPKVPEWVPQVCATGDVLQVNPSQQVVIFVHWMNGKDRVDLDLSVMLMGNGRKVGKVDFCCLQHSNIVHSGDYTSAPPPNGCSEYITFCPDQVVKANKSIEELFVLCFSFNGVSFDNMGQAFVGIGVIDNVNGKGLGPNGCTVLCGW
jgi:hypothetical protein